MLSDPPSPPRNDHNNRTNPWQPHSDEGTGEMRSTPFHVRFGKLQLLRSREKTVTVYVNNVETPLRMTLGKPGGSRAHSRMSTCRELLLCAAVAASETCPHAWPMTMDIFDGRVYNVWG